MSSDWQIEYRGTLADTAPLGDRRTLAAWGFSGISELSLLNLARGNLVLTVDGNTSFLTDLPWSYRDKIVVWRDGARYWHGWLTAVPRAANDQADQITMVFADPWWWFETTTMSDPVITNAVTGSVTLESPNGSVTLTAVTSVDWVEPSGTITFAWRDQSAWTVQGQIRRAIYAAIRGGAPLALGTIGIDAPASGQETRGTTALSYIQAACQFEPLSVGWWDYAGATPTLNVQPRSALSATSYAIGGGPLDVQCTALHEMQALAVRIRWQYTASDGSTSLVTERAGNDALPIGPNVLVLDSEVADNDALSEVMHYHIADRLYAALHPLAYEGRLSLTDNLSPLAAALPGTALNLTGGRTEWTTMAAVVQQVQLAVVDEAESITVGWGAPRHLGLSDWLALRDLGNAGADNARWDNSTPTTDDKKPGTYDDLNNTPAASPAGAIRIETKGGTWTKCGFVALNNTLPTRRWRTATESGQAILWCGGGGATSVSGTIDYSGSRTYDAATCVASGVFTDAHSAIGTQAAYSGTSETPYAPYGLLGPTTTPTTRTWSGAASGSWCCGNECGGTGNWSGGGTVTLTLSAEDTESDAIARRMAVAAWTDTVTVAIRTVPVTIATGAYDELRWGTYNTSGVYTPITGLSPWHRYRIIGTVQMQPVDELGSATGDWYDAGEASAVFIASLDGTGGAEWQYIQPTPGYRTRVTGLHVEEW